MQSPVQSQQHQQLMNYYNSILQKREQIKKTTAPLQFMKIIHMKPGMSKSEDFNTSFVVLDRYQPIQTKKDIIDQFLVADETAAIRLSLFEGRGVGLQPGDIVTLHYGHCSVWKGNLVLYAGRKGILTRTGRFTMLFNERRNMSQDDWEEDPPGSNNYKLKASQQNVQ
uniref:Uncharacterized protein n=1 Tax=Percolomonas cosmopolitus TaxID=63605 RepID=A0A7S1KUC9_9EUKA|mmetsp:Transcript_9494/g.35222  ORF Transcript_9494/g.35222 Transcript_9494/m.35222 type:complete len:168 (+) Transcript_9494:45-548(+)